MVKAYLKGRRIEYKCKRELEELGYTVLRSAGSHGPFDLIAIHPAMKTILLIQVKARELRPSELRRLLEELRKYNGSYTVEARIYCKKNGRYTLVR